jgi:hypothetical protein
MENYRVLMSTPSFNEPESSRRKVSMKTTKTKNNPPRRALTISRTYRNISVIAGDIVKNAPGFLTGFMLINQAAAWRYVKFYDKATAPVVGTDVPKMTIPLPPASGIPLSPSDGIYFSLGIGIAATTAIADADVGAPAANDVVASVFIRD